MRLKANLGFQTGARAKVAKPTGAGAIRGSMRPGPMGKSLGIGPKRKGGDFGPAISVDLSVEDQEWRRGDHAGALRWRGGDETICGDVDG